MYDSRQIDLPHGSELKNWVDQGFALFDKNNDGLMTIDEMVYIEQGEDMNRKLTCILSLRYSLSIKFTNG